MVRGSISNTGTAVLVLLLGMTCLTAVVHSAEWVVGGAKGWTTHINNIWPRGRPIRAGDVLVFSYNPSVHNVVEVDQAAYNSCVPRAGESVTYNSGNDRITLPRGTSYFICSFPPAGHCEAGMKIAVTAH